MYPGINQESIKVEDVPEDDDEDNPPSLAERDIVPPMASLVRGNRVMTSQMEECTPVSSKKRSKLKTCLKMMMRITLPV